MHVLSKVATVIIFNQGRLLKHWRSGYAIVLSESSVFLISFPYADNTDPIGLGCEVFL